MHDIKIHDVSFSYAGSDKLVLKDINVDVEGGEFVCILGQSGCGKSTLLRLIAGLEDCTTGEILVDGEKIHGASLNRGVVFQDYGLFPWKTAGANITLALKKKFPDWDKNHLKERTIELLKAVGLDESVYRKDKKKNIGYIIIHYSNEEFRTFFEELGTILTETARQYFEEKQKNTYLNLSLKDYIIGWMIFEGQHFVESEQSHTLKGNYLMALFTDDFSDMAVEAAKLGRIWEHFYLYEEKHSLTVVLYQVSEKNAQKIYQMAQKENLNCYMSETFEDINDCRIKRDLLKQMERIPKICDVRGVKREKDWYLQGIFSYTLPLIEEAGLSDYSILNLIKEDEKNHTELYDTLKMYLLCENNVTMAAEKLHVHRNTLVYRLKQIKDCLELDINNNEISRELLAFMIMYDLSKSSED